MRMRAERKFGFGDAGRTSKGFRARYMGVLWSFSRYNGSGIERRMRFFWNVENSCQVARAIICGGDSL